MAGVHGTTPAQRARDEALARGRRITWVVAAGAAGLAVAATGIAALTIPGRAAEQSGAPAVTAAPAPTPSDFGGGDQGPGAGGFGSSAQPPQPGGDGGAPAVVSGGS